MLARLNYFWRIAATGFCFASFGLGSLLLSLVIAPTVWLLPANRGWKRDTIHFVIHLSSCVFVWMLQSFGIMTLSINGRENLKRCDGQFVVANHPSLIDVVLLNSLVRRTACMVKEAVWYNPFMSGVARAAGYVSKADPEGLLERSATILESGRSLIVFPEGTRTRPGSAVLLQRGAANISLRAGKDITPVTIALEPSTLTKDRNWYEVPPEGPFHVTLTVGADIAVEPFLQTRRWLAARSLTAVLQEHFHQTTVGHEGNSIGR